MINSPLASVVRVYTCVARLRVATSRDRVDLDCVEMEVDKQNDKTFKLLLK